MSKSRETNADELSEIRARLASASGPEYWRSLEELAGTETFQHYLHREFPENASEMTDPETRRQFLKLMGASLALAGVSGCAIRTPEQIAPWVKAPENVVPGRPQFYATTMTFAGLATGLLVESHSGRPTKIEGNPDHPASLGSTDIFAQAASLCLYDPDRSQVVLQAESKDGTYGDFTYDDFLAKLIQEMNYLRPKKGAGLRILTETVGSPSLADQIQKPIPRRNGTAMRRSARTRPRPGPSWPSARSSTRSITSTRPTSSSRSTPISSPAALRDEPPTNGLSRPSDPRSKAG
jgi:MoCo/4Fe-4S cofactor protein with predicted Tat translocation signal